MVLESLEPKENDKFLKKKFRHFGGFGPPKTPQKPKKGGFRGARNPPKWKQDQGSKAPSDVHYITVKALTKLSSKLLHAYNFLP